MQTNAATFYAKPTRVEAFQWQGPYAQMLPEWLSKAMRRGYAHFRVRGSNHTLRIAMPGRTPVSAQPGDWIVNRDGTFIVHRDETFKRLYAPATAIPQYDMAMG